MNEDEWIMLAFFKKPKDEKLKSVVSGKVIPVESVEDAIFSSGAMGKGVAIEPEEEIIVSPCDGCVSAVMKESRHAVAITMDNGAEILIHEGLETVAMNGDGFECYVEEGQKIKTGSKLIKFSKEKIAQAGCSDICIMTVTNSDEFPAVQIVTGIHAKQGETVVVKF